MKIKSVPLAGFVFIAFLLTAGTGFCRNEQLSYASYGGIEAGVTMVKSANVDGTDGETNINGYYATVKLSKLAFGYRYAGYEWENTDELPFGNGRDDPWKQLHKIFVSTGHDVMLGEYVGFFFNLRGFAQFEEETDDSFGGTGFAGLVLNLPEGQLRFRLGAEGVYHDIETSVHPYGSIDWNVDAPVGPSLSLGWPESAFRYRFDEYTEIELGCDAIFKDYYRLADQSPVKKQGYLEIKEYDAAIAFKFFPIEFLELKAGVNYKFEREYTIYDSDGENEKDYETDNAWGGFLAVTLQF